MNAMTIKCQRRIAKQHHAIGINLPAMRRHAVGDRVKRRRGRHFFTINNIMAFAQFQLAANGKFMRHRNKT